MCKPRILKCAINRQSIFPSFFSSHLSTERVILAEKSETGPLWRRNTPFNEESQGFCVVISVLSHSYSSFSFLFLKKKKQKGVGLKRWPRTVLSRSVGLVVVDREHFSLCTLLFFFTSLLPKRRDWEQFSHTPRMYIHTHEGCVYVVAQMCHVLFCLVRGEWPLAGIQQMTMTNARWQHATAFKSKQPAAARHNGARWEEGEGKGEEKCREEAQWENNELPISSNYRTTWILNSYPNFINQSGSKSSCIKTGIPRIVRASFQIVIEGRRLRLDAPNSPNNRQGCTHG